MISVMWQLAKHLNQGRWKEAEELQMGVTKITKRMLSEKHSDTLISMANLTLTYMNQWTLEGSRRVEKAGAAGLLSLPAI